jgi:hypothetical protein
MQALIIPAIFAALSLILAGLKIHALVVARRFDRG